MITRKLKIYDTGPGFKCLLIEVAPGELPHLIPRYSIHEWVSRNGMVLQEPEKYFKDDCYLPEEYDNWKDASKACNELNDKHYKDFEDSYNK